MKIDGINPNEFLSKYYYLDQKGLSIFFSPSVVDKNDGMRLDEEQRDWDGDDLQGLLDRLQISENKYFIIRLLKRGDIISLLYLLDKQKMVQALAFFPRTKLIQFIHFLPKEVVLKMLLWVIPLRTLMQLFPTEIIFNILRSKRLDVSSFVAGYQNQPIENLRALMMAITGQNVEKMRQPELLAMLKQLSKEQILEGMKTMPQKQIFEFVFQEVKKDPELLMMIPKGEMMKVVSSMPKPNLLELFQLLPENTLVQFLSQLPDNLLAMSAALLDDKAFSYILIHQYPDLIASLATAA